VVEADLLVASMNKAVFLDRDGVINELIYYEEQGIVDSPFTPEQLRLFPGAGEAVKRLADAGFKTIIASNQPGIAKGHLSQETFEAIRKKMNEALASWGGCLSGEYYCFHHPEAKLKGLKKNCECRKPKPGLLLQAARELDISMSHSWMVGDGLTDIQAGKAAGCKTVLIGRMKCELCHFMDKENARPDAIASGILEAATIILNSEGKHENFH